MSDAPAPPADLREARHTALPPWHTLQPTILYCLRTVTAIGVALYTAFSLQLLSPMSSAITVLIVANPVSGALVSKSLWRLLGTFIGAAAAVLLMACLAQAPLLFYIALSLSIGLACVAATLLRFFKAYGAVLAGYTIIIVCAPAFADPQNVFTSAVSRLSAVAVGIASAALVFLLTRLSAPSQLGAAITGAIRNTAAILAAPDAAPDRRATVLAEANGLNEIIEYAAAGSANIARHARQLRLGAAGLAGILTALHPQARWPDGPAGDTLRATIASLGAFQPDRSAPMLDDLAQRRDQLGAWLDDPEPGSPDLADPDRRLDRLGAIERAHDLTARLHDAIVRLTATQTHGAALPTGPRLRPFLDWPTALRNGARGAIVTLLACMFWYITMWPSAPTLLSYLVPASCLLATNPSAARASVDFSTGTLLAIPASYVCETWMLPQITGFPLLLGALAICLLPGIWLQFHPRHGLRAFGYVVFFGAMITVRNPISFNDINLVNTWLAFIVGTAALVVVFRALLPPDDVRDANRLAHSLAAAVARAAGRDSIPARPVWEYLQVQKVARLTQRLQSFDAAKRHDVIDRALIAIELGGDVLRLRPLLATTALEPPERQAASIALTAIRQVRRRPEAAARTAADAARLLLARPDPQPGQRRIAALLHRIAILTEAASDFLSADKPVPLC